jgi:hypothetical protein
MCCSQVIFAALVQQWIANSMAVTQQLHSQLHTVNRLALVAVVPNPHASAQAATFPCTRSADDGFPAINWLMQSQDRQFQFRYQQIQPLYGT